MKKQILFLTIILILSTNIGQAGTLSTFYGTATITVPADLPSVDLALQLDLNGTAVLHDTSYIILEKTMLFPVIPPLVDAQEVGPRLEGTVGPDTFQLRTTPFSDQAGGKTVNRQIFFNNAVVGNQGNSITGEYNETVTGLLPHTHQANKYVANHSFTVYSHMLLYQYLFYQITQKGSICITS
ncbi:MAG: hypothetical protein D3917_14750, partial [Candidatus Electrothrix sp. AX5]|nr:hypothetical protein [Candidatus Electrothrix sp. AX5]